MVYSRNKKWTKFTFADLDKDGAKREAVGRFESKWTRTSTSRSWPATSWVTSRRRFASSSSRPASRGRTTKRLTRLCANLRHRDWSQQDHRAGHLRGTLPGSLVAQLDHRERNRRLTRVVTSANGRLAEFFPYYDFIDIEQSNQSIYLEFDKALPKGSHHTISSVVEVRRSCPMGWVLVEMLEKGRGGAGWQRLQMLDTDDGERAEGYRLNRSGALEFVLPEAPTLADEGFGFAVDSRCPTGRRSTRSPRFRP